MTFSGDLAKFGRKVVRRQKDIFVGTAEEVHRSIVKGSEITGAPGQPVDTGALVGSWQLEFINEWEARTATPQEYAPHIEDPPSGMGLKSQVGGFHSRKLTIAGFEKIVRAVRDRVIRGL